MLTDLKIKRMAQPLKNEKHTDRDGLELHNRKSGRKIFVFRFQYDKKPQTITLGRYPGMSLLDARQISALYRSLVDKGIDPREELRTNKKNHLTLKDAAESWLDKNRASWRTATLNLHLRAIYRDIIPLAGEIPIKDITRKDILSIIHPHEVLGHHEIAHRLLSRLKAIFDYALASDLTTNYPFNGLKKALSPKPKVTNHVSINPNEAHQMIRDIQLSKANVVTKLYIELLAHLFTRPSELRLAKWAEFDLQKSEWNVPEDRMKMDKPLWVPLTPIVLEHLKELRLITGNTPFLFSSTHSKNQKPISETCARNLLHKLGFKNRHCLHGFRSLASTVIHSETHFKSDAIEAQQARKVQGVRGIYLRAEFKKERREMMNWYSNWLVKDHK